MQKDYENKMMSNTQYKDKRLKCVEPKCFNEFIFSVGEQQYFNTKGLSNPPKRCPACRDKRKKEGLNQSNDSR